MSWQNSEKFCQSCLAILKSAKRLWVWERLKAQNDLYIRSLDQHPLLQKILSVCILLMILHHLCNRSVRVWNFWIRTFTVVSFEFSLSSAGFDGVEVHNANGEKSAFVPKMRERLTLNLLSPWTFEFELAWNNTCCKTTVIQQWAMGFRLFQRLYKIALSRVTSTSCLALHCDIYPYVKSLFVQDISWTSFWSSRRIIAPMSMEVQSKIDADFPWKWWAH